MGGFTLLELLVAISIFTIMSMMAYGGLHTLLTTRDHTDRAAEQFAMLQSTFLFMQQDLAQAVGRGTRDEFGDNQPPFSGGNSDELLAFVHGGAMGLESVYMPLQHVAYRLDGEQLQRLSWPVLDRTQGSEPDILDLTDGVLGVAARFSHDEWQDSWPQRDSGEDQPVLPRAVEVVLMTERWGEIRRTFLVAP
ncbi:MAG: type II secretion system minor pseudopilin GspJ [Candidatus Sedimenticola sp. (ex Thyasira tokunagai)]